MNLATLPSFPCHADKSPVTRHGFYDARVHRSTAAFELVGIPTGERSGIDILDCDPHGLAWFNEVPIPATRHQFTRRGIHVFFRHADDLCCSSNRVATGVEVRADGGYFIDWAREGYETLWPDLIVDWPGWLLSKARGGVAPVRTPQGSNGHRGINASMMATCPPVSSQRQGQGHYHNPTKNLRARVQYNVGRLERQRSPGRTALLFEVACQFAEMIAEGRMTPENAMTFIMGACWVNGLIRDYGREECRRQIANAFRVIEKRELNHALE
jgi:hypothetical protein